MFNYKKSLLSITTAAALAVTSVSAGYIPLTDTGNNEQAWTLFGVTGLQISGAGAGTSAGAFSITDSTKNAVEDDTIDELFVEGLVASTGEDLAKVKAISPLSFIEVRVDTSDAVFNETEPVRTMYVTLTEGGGPSFAFSYRASLEGERMEYSQNTDGANARTITISSEYTYNNPAYGEIIQEVAGIPGAGLVSLTDIVDYDFSNNPIDSAFYDKDATPSHQDTAGTDQYLRVYTYDAATEVWGLYDSRNAAEANDFDTLEKGKAYWAKMDDNTSATVGGLVLGSSSISAADYATAGITDGWNLMAFDKANPDIRKSTTGLIATLNGGAGGVDLRIYDSSGNHYVDANTTASDIPLSTRNINQAIKEAKVEGLFPDTFDLRAFPVSGTEVALISSKRFILSESNSTNDAVTVIKTLAGEKPYSVDVTDLVNTDDVSTNGIEDLGVIPTGMDATHNYLQAMSKYGEYAMVIEPLYGTDTAQAAGNSRIHLQSASASATTNSAVSTGATLGANVTNLGNGTTGVDIGGDDAFAYEIDTDSTAGNDKVLIASKEPFYIRDHTFTRVFEYTDTNLTGAAYIRGTGTDADISLLLTDANATLAATKFDGQGDVNATVDPTNSNQLIIIADADDSNEFTITEATTTDHLEDAVSSSDLAKGAVKGVYSLSNLATMGLVNTTDTNGTELTSHDDTADTYKADFDTLNGNFTGTAVAVTTAALVSTTTMATFIKSVIENEMSAQGIQYDSVTVTAADPHHITIVSSEVTDFVITGTEGGGGPTGSVSANGAGGITLGKPDTLSADLASDLKFNAVYTPNYVVDGPLYTMKESGFTLKAMVTGTTDLSDGSINWDSIDLTRKPSEWLDSQDYNLFKIDEKSGYWAYLETDSGSNNVAISNAALTPLTYTYHFNEVGASGTGTNYNHVSGNIALTVDGLDEYDDRKSAVIKVSLAGSEVELAKEAGSDVYNGKLSSYEIENMPAGYSYEVLANLADGLGYNQKSLDTGLIVDYAKPDAPSVTLGDGTSIVLSSTSTDVAGYYIFDGQIPEMNPAQSTDLFKKLTADEAAAGYGLCADTTKLTWFTSAYELNVIAVDVTGVLGQGNVSDTTEQKYVPMLKDAVRLENSRAGALVPTTEGNYYDASCADQGIPTENYGVTLTATIDLTTVTMSYTPKNVTDTTATPISLFVSNGGAIAKITYADVYVGDSVYVEVGSQVFSLVLPSLAEIEGADVTATPLGGNTSLFGAVGVGASTANPLPLVDGAADEDTDGDGVITTTGYAELQSGQNL